MSVETSPSIGELAAALAKAQGEISAASARTENPMFRSFYADLADVWKAIRKPLSDNGLSVVQLPSTTEGGVDVVTLLLHSSGQWIQSRLWMPADRSDAQGLGSALTYARRYALAAVIGVAQDDDDGNAASEPRAARVGGFVKEGVYATLPQLAALEEARARAGVVVCGDLLDLCPWKTSKWSKREGRSVEKSVMCAHHAELAQWKTATGESVRDAAQLTFEQCDLLIANYRKKAERKERRAAQTPDVGWFKPSGSFSVGCDPPGTALFVGDAIRPRADGSVEQLEEGLIVEGNMRTGALRVVGPVDGHATMPRAEYDAGTVLRALSQSDMPEQELCAQFGVETVGELTYGDIPDALCLIGDYGTERYDLTVAKLREKQEAARG